MTRQYRAPTAHGAVLAEPDFDAIPALVRVNRDRLDWSNVTIGGRPLRDLRQQAYDEVIHSAREYMNGRGEWVPGSVAYRWAENFPPLLLAGHQPELSHPGVWVKNFALNGLAKKLDGIPLNLIVDSDTLKSTSLRFPTFRDRDPHSVRLESLAFDTLSAEMPYEARTVLDAEMFRTFADRAAPLWANWGYEPLLATCWSVVRSLRERVANEVSDDGDPNFAAARQPLAGRAGHTVGDAFTALRRARERAWGCDNLELPVSSLAQTEAFARFAQHILGDLPRVRAVYNAAIRAYREVNGIHSTNHPAPELEEGEAPFWVRTATGRRARATPASDVRTLRPRALTLTLFARVCLGDFFIHGIGGGKYDEVTDAIIRDYFGIEPPAYQVLSATLHLPLPAFPSTEDDLKRTERHVRDLHWNPQRHLGADERAKTEVQTLLDTHARLGANEPPFADHAARRDWYRALKDVKEKLRPLVANQVPGAEADLMRVRSEIAANAILRRRDFAWVLYPEEVLREFFREFLHDAGA